MLPATIKRLASAEYDFVAIDAKLSDLAELLDACAHDVKECKPAAQVLRVMRRQLRRVLDSIDVPLTAAVLELETIVPPF